MVLAAFAVLEFPSEQIRRVGEGLLCLGPDRAHRLEGERWILRAGIASAIGLHDEDGERVGHDVMQIAGNARPLGDLGLLLALPGGKLQRMIALAEQPCLAPGHSPVTGKGDRDEREGQGDEGEQDGDGQIFGDRIAVVRSREQRPMLSRGIVEQAGGRREHDAEEDVLLLPFF